MGYLLHQNRYKTVHQYRKKIRWYANQLPYIRQFQRLPTEGYVDHHGALLSAHGAYFEALCGAIAHHSGRARSKTRIVFAGSFIEIVVSSHTRAMHGPCGYSVFVCK
jgi:hypothetical protein